MAKYPKPSLKRLKNAAEKAKTSGNIRKAAREANIQTSTLSYFIKRQKDLTPNSKRGPPQVLTKAEENELKVWIVESLNAAKPKSQIEIQQKAAEIRNRRSEDDTPIFQTGSPNSFWIKSFMTRHNLSLKSVEPIQINALQVKRSDLNRFFKDTEESLNDKNILNSPSNVYNFASNKILFEIEYPVIAPRGSKNIYDVRKSVSKGFATLGLLVSACGNILPPQIIFKTNVENKDQLKQHCIEKGFFFTTTINGFQNKVSFNKYIKFVAEKMEKPSVLFIDNDCSHSDLSLVRWCEKKNIFLKYLPAHTTHILQPLDVTVFRSLTSSYRQEYENWKLSNNNLPINESIFVDILKTAHEDIPIQIIEKGFEKSGLYPFLVSKNLDRFIDDDDVAITKTSRKHSEVDDSEEAGSSTQISKRLKLIQHGKLLYYK